MANPADDLPPGTEGTYAAGPLANPKPPSVAAVRATGQSPDSYFAPGNPGSDGGLPVVQAASAPAGNGYGALASGLLQRAAAGFASLFGGTPATVQPASNVTVAGNSAANEFNAGFNARNPVAARTGNLESGLNALEQRSTGFRTSPNIVTNPPVAATPPPIIATNSAADQFNSEFNQRRAADAAQAAQAASPLNVPSRFRSQNPPGQQPTIPTFYQQKLAENQ